jgi:hypothetical protein
MWIWKSDEKGYVLCSISNNDLKGGCCDYRRYIQSDIFGIRGRGNETRLLCRIYEVDGVRKRVSVRGYQFIVFETAESDVYRKPALQVPYRILVLLHPSIYPSINPQMHSALFASTETGNQIVSLMSDATAGQGRFHPGDFSSHRQSTPQCIAANAAYSSSQQ